MAKWLCVAALLVLAVSVSAQKVPLTPQERFNLSHQAGIRLGYWGNQGGKTAGSSSDSLGALRTDISNASFYFEAYFGIRLSRPLMLELSGGVANRGSVNIQDNVNSLVYYGNLLVYPIQARLKWYPFGSRPLKYQPYLMAGGGVYHGRISIQITNDLFAYYSPLNNTSATTINYVAGAGLDYPIASQIGLDINCNYMPIHFSSELIGAKDYSAFTITVGVKYLYASRKK